MDGEQPVGAGVAVDERPGGVVVRLTGEVDFREAPGLRAGLEQALASGADRVVVDLAGVTFIDSMGLGVIVAAWRRGRADGVAVDLWRPSRKAWAVLRLARLDRLMGVVHDDDPFPAA